MDTSSWILQLEDTTLHPPTQDEVDTSASAWKLCDIPSVHLKDTYKCAARASNDPATLLKYGRFLANTLLLQCISIRSPCIHPKHLSARPPNDISIQSVAIPFPTPPETDDWRSHILVVEVYMHAMANFTNRLVLVVSGCAGESSHPTEFLPVVAGR